MVTWGTADFGGDTTAVQEQLKTVQQIQATRFAFAAILVDGTVVTWGVAHAGGDSSAVQEQLKNVQQIQATHSAVAAILADGPVVTWGDADGGGDSSAVQEQLKNVEQIQASVGAFAAILGDGSVVTWGNADCGGDSSAVRYQRDMYSVSYEKSEAACDLMVSMGCCRFQCWIIIVYARMCYAFYASQQCQTCSKLFCHFSLSLSLCESGSHLADVNTALILLIDFFGFSLCPQYVLMLGIRHILRFAGIEGFLTGPVS